jgi:molybdate transport system substrate-binding protein
LLHWQALRRAHLVNKYSVFAHNTLAVVTPPTPGRVRRLQDLSLPGVRLVLAGGNVPAGRYADQVIWALDASGRFGRGYRRRVAANVVSRETNVRSVLSKVMLGEADAGIVYVTDAVTTKGKVNWLAIPARFNATAIYPITMIADSTQKALAAEFIRFVRGGESKRILASHGFRP